MGPRPEKRGAPDRGPDDAGSSRREFLGTAALTGAAALLRPSRVRAAPPQRLSRPAEARGPGFFSDEKRAALAGLADHVLPDSASWGAVEYIEQLLTAFDHDPPRLYAGGPYSGRHPFSRDGQPTDRYPENDFASFLPLNRLQEHAWRLRLYGSDAVRRPNREILGPVPGLRPLLAAGAGEAAALAGGGKAASSIWDALSEEFRESFTALVIEASFGDPVYGGNRGGAGWRAIHFEGDSQPLGYTLYDASTGSYRERPGAPVTRVGPGPGPDPLGFWTRAWLRVLAFATRRAAS